MVISLSFVACLQQARAIFLFLFFLFFFFKAKRDFEVARAWREKTGGCLLSPSHVPIWLSITTNQKFKTCACHISHVRGSRNTHLLLAWVKARYKKEGLDPNKGSTQLLVEISSKRCKVDFTVGNIYFLLPIILKARPSFFRVLHTVIRLYLDIHIPLFRWNQIDLSLITSTVTLKTSFTW